MRGCITQTPSGKAVRGLGRCPHLFLRCFCELESTRLRSRRRGLAFAQVLAAHRPILPPSLPGVFTSVFPTRVVSNAFTQGVNSCTSNLVWWTAPRSS